MALNLGALKKWAKGAPQDALQPDEEQEQVAEEGGEAPPNPIWSGESASEEDIDPESAEEFIEWLEENEPDIYAAIVEIGTAAASGDEQSAMMAGKMLTKAEQYLTPEYPPFTPQQRGAIAQALTEVAADPGTPEWSSAVAGAVAGARSQQEEPQEEEAPLGAKPMMKKPLAKPPIAKKPMIPGKPPMGAKPGGFGGKPMAKPGGFGGKPAGGFGKPGFGKPGFGKKPGVPI